MALIFAFGICLLIYWWFCHKTESSNPSLSKGNHSLMGIDETTPFVDIRGTTTLRRQYSKRQISDDQDGVYFEENEDELLQLQTQRNNVYDLINDGIDENEDGDELIAHYGSNQAMN